MRDIAVFLLLIACIGAAFWRPWLGVLALAVFSYLSPHTYAWGFIRSFPVYLILFVAVALAFLTRGRDRQPIPHDWRIAAFYLLWFHFLITTLDAIVPDAAWPKLIEVSKIYLPLIFTLLLINTREKLFYLIITIATCFGLIAVKGGIWAIGSGFSHRVYGPPGTQYGENNALAIAILTSIPLLILWIREASDRRIKFALMAAIPLLFASALSSQSRGALLTIGVLVPVLLWQSRHKSLALPVLIAGIFIALQVLPEQWFGRMSTIETYQTDASAQGRLEAWRDGISYAFSHPLTGAGFNGWMWVTKRDWHSAYVESLAEHGFIGFFLWVSLLFGSMLSLTRLPRRTRHIPEMKWVANYSYMLRASLIAYATGSVFLGITYWDLLYHLIFIAVLVKKFALEELAQYEGRPLLRSSGRPRMQTGPSEPVSARLGGS